MEKLKTDYTYYLVGSLVSLILTALIAWTAMGLGDFEIVGKTEAFQYPWRLVESSDMAQITAWLGYITHNVTVWLFIYMATHAGLKYTTALNKYNWFLIIANVFFALLHMVQTNYWYDGLARDTHEITALGSVAIMLVVIIILETPRRGLVFGYKYPFHKQFMHIVRKYHGYFFSWAIIYDYWYHPTVGTSGHLMGFYYNFLLFVQCCLIFNRAHLNKYWTFFLEAFVLIHAVAVAFFQHQPLWPMFAFGFAAMIILTQMHGLGLSTWTKRLLALAFVLSAVFTYGYMDKLSGIHEVIRIPVIDYTAVFFIYFIYLFVAKIYNVFFDRGTGEGA